MADVSIERTGLKALSHGADPTPASANAAVEWHANRAGIPWIIGGHPNTISREYVATTAQTNDAIIDTVGANDKVIITQIQAVLSSGTSVDIDLRIGFGTASVPAEPADGASIVGIVLSDPGLSPGGKISRGNGEGIIAIGAASEELRITMDRAPDDGRLRVLVSYHIVAEA